MINCSAWQNEGQNPRRQNSYDSRPKVVLDADLARLRCSDQNPQPGFSAQQKPLSARDFAFRLSGEEYDAMRSQIVIASSGMQDMRSQIVTGSLARSKRSQTATGSRRNIRYRPWVFTEHGALQVANILRSDRAIAMSVICHSRVYRAAGKTGGECGDSEAPRRDR
jgi:hypothetical protein